MMKVTFVVSSLRLSGGVILIVEISNRLALRGHEVSLLAPYGTTDREISQRIHKDVAVCEASVGLPTSPGIFEQARLVAALISSTPTCDVLIATHTPTTLPVLLGSWWKSTKRLWLYMDYPEMFRSRRVEHFLLLHMPKYFSKIVAISRPLADQIDSHPGSDVFVMHPGLGLDPMQSNVPKRPQPGSRLRILYVGDDRPRKGLQEFISAMEEVQRICPSTLAVIVCKTPCHISSNIVHEIHVRPDNATLAMVYEECDVFVSTSWGEGLGYPPLQAMAFGKPVVVADSGGVQDYAVDFVNALVVPARDAQSVANAVLKLIGNESLRRRLGANGKQTAARYNWENAVEQFENVLRKTIQQ